MKKLFTMSILVFFVFALSGCLDPEDKTENQNVTTPSSTEGDSSSDSSGDVSTDEKTEDSADTGSSSGVETGDSTDSGSSSDDSTETVTRGSLKLLLTDAPADEVYEAVYVVFDKVEVHVADAISDSVENGEEDKGDSAVSEDEKETEENAGDESENTEENKNGEENGAEESSDSDTAVSGGESEGDSQYGEVAAFRKPAEDGSKSGGSDDAKVEDSEEGKADNPEDESEIEKAENPEDVESGENSAEENGSWITLKSDEGKINLLELNNGKFTELGVSDLAPGKYTQIRITVKLATVVIKGEEIPMKLPSGTLKLVRPFTIEPGITTELVADFDAMKSVKKRGTGEYIMSPVIRLVEKKTTGAIAGEVIGDAEQVAVTSMLDGSKESYSGTVADEEGVFKLAYLEPGIYDILIESAGFEPVVVEDIEVKAGEVTTLPEPFELLAEQFGTAAE